MLPGEDAALRFPKSACVGFVVFGVDRMIPPRSHYRSVQWLRNRSRLLGASHMR